MKNSIFSKIILILFLAIAAGAFLSPLPSAHGADVVYEDGEDGEILGWDEFRADPAGAKINNVYDEDRQSRVIEFSGTGPDRNGYRLKNPDLSIWNNDISNIIQWKMKYSESYSIYILCRTTDGQIYIRYTPSDDTGGWEDDDGEYVSYGLGSSTIDGQWHTITRNLEEDLRDLQPDERIIAVDAFLIKGSGRIDDIKLLEDPDKAPTVFAERPAMPAFPGAEGYGADTIGGRGGRIIEVTNLNTSGPGSFKEAVETPGPRIVVFRVGGRIDIAGNITINHPYITIAGQTAPGDGICIGGKGGFLKIKTRDVIVRGLRVRVGDKEPWAPDGIGITNDDAPPYNIIIDHCSVSWGIDENISISRFCHDITIQWSITSEALRDSWHEKGEHSKGMLIMPGAERISIHHNLFAHNVSRNPLISVNTETEVVNNVVYNWSAGINLGNNYPENGEKCNVIGNYMKPGPYTYGSRLDCGFLIDECWQNAEVYVQGNIGPGRPTDTGDEWSVVTNEVGDHIKSLTPAVQPSGITTQSATEAYDLVLDNAGVITPRRDAVDIRIIQDVHDSTGSIIDSQDEVDGWPTYAGGTAPPDSDHDGMPDDWENSYGLNPNDPSDSDGEDIDSRGYTNIEVYINGLITMPVATFLYGDVNNSGRVTAYDAALAVQCAIGLIDLTQDQRMMADVTGDGQVSSYDASLIAQYAIGMIDKFPVEE